MKDEYSIKNEEEMVELGQEFAKQLKPSDVVLLYGELGSGKTTFTKGLAKGLGVVTRIISPTFILHRSHHIDSNLFKTLNHVDLYRLNDKNIKSFDLENLLEDRNSVTVIEWPEVIEKTISKKAWKVKFAYEEEARKVKFNYE